MSLLVRFSPESLTRDQYDEVQRRLNDGGHWPPEGLEYHVCFGTEGQMRVSEILVLAGAVRGFRAASAPDCQ